MAARDNSWLVMKSFRYSKVFIYRSSSGETVNDTLDHTESFLDIDCLNNFSVTVTTSKLLFHNNYTLQV